MVFEFRIMECRDRKPETIVEDVEKYDFQNRENLNPNGHTPSTKNETPNRYIFKWFSMASKTQKSDFVRMNTAWILFMSHFFIILMTSAKLKQKKCEKREIEKINGKHFWIK